MFESSQDQHGVAFHWCYLNFNRVSRNKACLQMDTHFGIELPCRGIGSWLVLLLLSLFVNTDKCFNAPFSSH